MKMSLNGFLKRKIGVDWVPSLKWAVWVPRPKI